MNINCNIHVCSFLANKPKAEYDEYPKSGPLGLREGEYEFQYDYPLDTVAKFKRKLNAKHSARNILRFAARDYKKIYDAEDDPGYRGKSFNRGMSAGPYGIWGHYMGDLYFEGIHIDENKKVIKFGMGS
jgi:hypothetical protein